MDISSRALAFVFVFCVFSVVTYGEIRFPESCEGKEILVSGRTFCENGRYYFDWSGTMFNYSIIGTTSLSIHLEGNSSFDFFVNGEFIKRVDHLESPPEIQEIVLLTKLDKEKEYTIAFVKITEPLVGAVLLDHFSIDDGGSVKPPKTHERNIEFIGDSLTVGYGDLGKPPCHFSPQTESSFAAYGRVVANYFGANLYAEAWSGKGMVRNYGDPSRVSKKPFPAFYPYILASDEKKGLWDFSYIPEVVVINLGSNDYTTEPHPTDEEYINGTLSLAAFLRLKYDVGASLFFVCGPIVHDPCCRNLKNAVHQLNYAGDKKVFYVEMEKSLLNPDEDIGCDGHPNVKGQGKMAEIIIESIRSELSW